jgi:asparagine synthase (glutamine-hydrolysing)
MSIIFGVRKPAGAIASEPELLHLAQATTRYAVDGVAVKVSGRVGMGFQPYYTHQRSTLEHDPAIDMHGNLLAFDGRLDNYADLSSELGLGPIPVADSQILLAAFLRWGDNCFCRFIGDWALALWSDRNQSLYLARDHAGTRTLYFQDNKGTLLWSTHLETFFVDGATKRLDEDYVACYLASRPIRDLTPYEGVRAVLPAHHVALWNDKLSQRPHWQWMATKKIQYSSDEEYEEHFLTLFKQAVERRTGPGAPILAQLSGGMDSTSIVCVSDRLRREENPAANILDTISFYDDSEPSWNERPYFSIVEAARGKVGIHLETSFRQRTFELHDRSHGVYLLPGADSVAIQQELKFQDAAWQRGYRVVLSGSGGDEVLGGVPIPLPELAGYLVSGNIQLLLSRSIAWCLTDRSPLINKLLDTVRYTFLLYLNPQVRERSIPQWITSRLRDRCIEIANNDAVRCRHLGLSPPSIDNGLAWWSIMESLPHLFPRVISRQEYRYPYLDRDLVDFLFGIPREQVLRPGRRRSLMRRSLAEIVPVEVLERRRKAFQLRGPLLALQHARSKLEALFAESQIGRSGLVNAADLQHALELTTRGGDPQSWKPLMRAITLELWLKTNPTFSEGGYELTQANTGSPASSPGRRNPRFKR